MSYIFYNIATVDDVSLYGNSIWEAGRIGKLWVAMLQRCYGTGLNSEAYEDVVMCDEWLTFSNFHRDVQNLPRFQEWYECEDGSMSIDKDAINPASRTYGPDTCQFMSRAENSREAALRRWGIDPDSYLPVAVGQRYRSIYGSYEVLEVVNSKDVLIRFDNTGNEVRTRAAAVRDGLARDPYVKVYRGPVQIGALFESQRCGMVEVVEEVDYDHVMIKFLDSGVVKQYLRDNVRAGRVVDFSLNERRDVFVGSSHQNKYGQTYVVTQLIDSQNVTVEFVATGYQFTTSSARVRNGIISDRSDAGKRFVAEFMKSNKRNKLPSAIAKSDKFVGQVFPTNNNGDVEIIKFESCRAVTVRFANTGYETVISMAQLKSGSVKDKSLMSRSGSKKKKENSIVGQIFPTNKGGDVEVLKYEGVNNVTVRFLNTGYETLTRMSQLRLGSVKDKSLQKGISL